MEKKKRIGVIGAGMGKSSILTHLALHAPDPGIVILESKPLNLGKLIPKPIEVAKLPVNYNRFRQGSKHLKRRKERNEKATIYHHPLCHRMWLTGSFTAN